MTKIFNGQSNLSFVDLISESFFYHDAQKFIKIGFDSFIEDRKLINKNCAIVIKNWAKTKSRAYNTKPWIPLESNLGIVSLIMQFEFTQNSFEVIINTTDNRYVEWRFEEVTVEINVCD